MNRYEPHTPRALFGFAAVAMTAATLAISIFVPASLGRDTAAATDLLTRVESERYVPADKAIVTGIDVIAVRHVPAVAPVAPVAQSRDTGLGDVRG